MPSIQEDSNVQKEQRRQTRNINKQIDILDKKIDSLYKDIYISRTDNRKNLDDIIDSIDNTIDKLQGADYNASGISELLRRVDQQEKSNSTKLMKSVSELFENENVVGNIIMNDDVHRFISAQNYNFDLICKYLPRLQDALEIKRDNVLCADSFDKEYLFPQSPSVSKDEINIFNANVDKIEAEYDISDFLDDTYMKVSKYGEDFIYIVPYPVAFERMIKRQNRRGENVPYAGSPTRLFEGYSPQMDIVTEDFGSSREFISFAKDIQGELGEYAEAALDKMPELGSVNLYFNTTNVIQNPLQESTTIESIYEEERFKSMHSIYESGSGLTSVFNNKIANKGKIDMSTMSGLQNNDGLILSKSNIDPDKIDKDMLGAVLERIPRENIIPVYMGKKCAGYYYLEFADDPSACGFCGGHHAMPGIGNANQYHYEMTEDQQELAIRFISSRISRSIDTKFINANKDLKEEIYAVLRYNEKFDISRTNNIGVTFIPAEDIVHCYFKQDEVTHRGISDLQNALVPAMLYILLYLTDIIGKITRSNDKRLYYVKQNVEQNTARTMMNVVNQIKKGNMGIRQIESMNNILNIVGKYNDLLIPQSQSGESPIQFDIMQGQDIQTPTDMLEKMEEAAINTIMPYELVNSTMQQDFAIRYSMSNNRFLRSIITRQRKTQKFFTKIYTPLYNYEFGTNYMEIKIVLPPPIVLILQNNSQLFDNVSQMADKISDMELTGENDEEIKPVFKKMYVRKTLSSYMDYEMIDNLIDQAKVMVEAAKTPAVEETDDDVNDMMDDSL